MVSSHLSHGEMVSSALPVAEVSRRERVVILGCIALATALAWAYLVHLSGQMTAGVDYANAMAAMGMPMNAPWTAEDGLFTFAMWSIMMVGMMGPAASPMFLLFAGARVGRGHPAVSLATLSFGLGYIAVWTGFSAAATLVQYGLHEAALLSAAMATSSSSVSAAILVAAGIYQLTPWKERCLKHCRSPLGFFMTHWRDGAWGAFEMGFRHGLFCLGCCWALMGLLFAVGVMNLVWVAALAAFVLIEKIGWAGAMVVRIAGLALVVWGVVVVAKGGF
jgi:predicted metal-binding membrane protein